MALCVNQRGVDVLLVPLARKEFLAVLIDCRCHHTLDDVHVVADGGSGQRCAHLLDQFLYGAVADVGEQTAFEEGINPLFQGVSEGVSLGMYSSLLTHTDYSPHSTPPTSPSHSTCSF